MMIFIYELDPYPVDIYRMCENELSIARLSKVIILQTDRQTDHRNIYHAASQVVNNIAFYYEFYVACFTKLQEQAVSDDYLTRKSVR